MYAVLFFLEKNWRHEVMQSRISGVGLRRSRAVIVQPDVLHLVGGPMT